MLHFSHSGSVRTRHRLLWLLMPCLPLADRCTSTGSPDGSGPSGLGAHERVEELLADLPNPSGGEVDRRWEWAVAILLDPELRDFLCGLARETGYQGLSDSEKKLCPSQTAPRSMRTLTDILALDVSTLGPRPPDLVGPI